MKYEPSAEKSMWFTPAHSGTASACFDRERVRVGEVERLLGLRDDDRELAVRA